MIDHGIHITCRYQKAKSRSSKDLNVPLHLKAPTGEYKVITTQDVDMTEFEDTYEITNYKDGVYTVQMKGEQ